MWEIDFRKNRIYLPQDDMARFGVTEGPDRRKRRLRRLWNLMRFPDRNAQDR